MTWCQWSKNDLKIGLSQKSYIYEQGNRAPKSMLHCSDSNRVPIFKIFHGFIQQNGLIENYAN